MQIKKGTTDVTLYFHLRASADGTSKTGLVYNSAGAVASYVRTRGTRTAISLATLAAADSAHADGGFKEVDGTNAKGLYRLDVADAAFASGVDEVIIHIGFTDAFEESLAVELVDERSGNLAASQEVQLNAQGKLDVNAEADSALSDIKLDHLIAVADADDPVDDSIIAKLTASDGDWSGFDKATDALEAIRDRGDSEWVTGGGSSITDIVQVVPSIPFNIDLANTKTIRLALYLLNSLDDLPSTAEITPGTITIERSADSGTSWSVVVNAAACTEQAGQIYYDEVFDSGSGYASNDMIRITFKGQKITVAANDYEITDDTHGWMFHTRIDGSVGDSAATVADAVWNELQSGHVDAGSFGKYLDTEISGIAAAIGSGLLSCTWTQKDGSGNPMDNVQIWITTDEAGSNVVAGALYTNTSGEATFMLDAGTYYVWREKGGYNFTNPQSWTVS